MHNDEEPIVFMARIIYTRVTADHESTPWDQLDDKQKTTWLHATAIGWDSYWSQREYLESRPHRSWHVQDSV